MTLHVLHAGDGYTYLTRQVATGDLARQGKAAADPMTAYYHAAGAPPGRWIGSGCADLDVSGEVAEAQMQALFGEGLHPNADKLIATAIDDGKSFSQAIKSVTLGRKYARYDKEVPLAVELNAAYERFEQKHNRRPSVEERRDLKEQTAAALLTLVDPQHNWSTAEIRKYIIDELGRVRQPVAGFDLVFTPRKSAILLGVLGGRAMFHALVQAHREALGAALDYGEREAAFTRVGAGGIAQVDTNGFVAVAFDHFDSRAGDPLLHTHVAVSNRVMAADGKWRTLDSRQMHRVAVSMSETYNLRFEDALTRLLGVRWTEVSKGMSKRAVREVAGVPLELIKGFSQRRAQVETGYDRLVAEYVRAHGRTPPRSVQYELAQRACLEDRPEKGGLKTLAQQIAEWSVRAQAILPGADIPAIMQAASGHGPAEQSPETIDPDAVAAAAIDTVSLSRTTWTIYHVKPEVERRLVGLDFATAAQRDQLVDTIVQRALGTHSLMLDIPADPAVPRLLQKANGESVFRRRGSERFSSQEVLDAEERLLREAQTERGPRVSTAVIDTAIDHLERHVWERKKTLNPGQRALVQHFVGCNRALAVAIGPPGTGKSTAMRAVREAWEAIGGRVIGLAPSAAAAAVLGDELEITADTMHALLTAHRNGVDVDVREGDMLLVDEAGMAGTRLLDELADLAANRGAVVRLVGDHRQLTAVEAGGALRLIYHESGGAELTEVRRFQDPTEAAALLRFRVGQTDAASWYADNNRLHSGVRASVIDKLYSDWQNDQANDKTSIMISDTNEIVQQLSARAQADRRAAGLSEPTGVELHDGNQAGAGDRIVTRKNMRRLVVNDAMDFVKNGDLWEVCFRYDDGSLLVQHLQHNGVITLPADYVSEYVELGYASTVHRSQGLTVWISRAHLSVSAMREAALVALSRGIFGNFAYLETDEVVGYDEPETLPGDLFHRSRERTAAEQALAAIIAREGAELSATEELRAALEEPYQLDNAIPQYEHGLSLHGVGHNRLDAEQWVRNGIPQLADDVLADEAWPALSTLLHEAERFGQDPAELLARRAVQRELGTAESITKVLHYRITIQLDLALHDDPARPADFPGWVPSPPTETPFTEYQHLPEYDRETARRTPTFTTFGGPGPDQFKLDFDHHDHDHATPDRSGAVLFDVAALFPAAPTPTPELDEADGVDRRALLDLEPQSAATLLPHGAASTPPGDPEPSLIGLASLRRGPLQAQEPSILGGPDVDQLMLFSTDTEQDDERQALADPAQLALFSADQPHRQTDLLDLADWLQDKAISITDRVRTLADRSADDLPPWTAGLGPLPTDPLDRQGWLSRAGQVAAYRERWYIPGHDPTLLGPKNVRGAQLRARKWVEKFLNPDAEREPVRAGGGRDPRERRRTKPAPTKPAPTKHSTMWTDLRNAATTMLNLEAEQWVHNGTPQHAAAILADPAWPALAARLHDIDEAGLDPAAVLAEQAARRELGTATSIAQVLHYRVGSALADTPATSTTETAMQPASPLTEEAHAARKTSTAEPARTSDPARPGEQPQSSTVPAAEPAPGTAEFWAWVNTASQSYLDHQAGLESGTPPEDGEPPRTQRTEALRERLARLRERVSGHTAPAEAHPDVDHEVELVDLHQIGEVDLDLTEPEHLAEDQAAVQHTEADEERNREQQRAEDYRRDQEASRDKGAERD